ncbi:c-type cytochrome [Sphingomonas abietis]|uniref:C-type cytochrome n=1 Tax=Sphingomonas abietis TaxID=3012344 RepID=A0ABY7NK34_9SPHN|nr:c-type cytochrome [Sphingomonas abietis]WBO21320.1 c-type cytochrome [Sphingomonas abietis]
MTRLKAMLAVVSAVLLSGVPTLAGAQDRSAADRSLIERGHALAVAGDCSACHGPSGAGGLAIQSPMGAIYASNITPDTTNGIGRWTEPQFADALRKGRSPDKGWLYPAMPYPSFTGLSDDDVKALYAYYHLAVAPQPKTVPATHLPFPFWRPAMVAWNLFNLHVGKVAGAVPVQTDAEKRGRYLVETLAHCSTCHTPRGLLMGEIGSQHMAGGFVGTWIAPNITPSPEGIGDWSDADLRTFLKTGHVRNHVAGGDMGLAVERSFSQLPDSDLDAMIAYLRKLPPVDGKPARSPVGAAKPTDVAQIEAAALAGVKKPDFAAVTDGAVLYQGGCASCHGQDGGGSSDGAFPSLVQSDTARSYKPNNLILTIYHGIQIQTPSGHAAMPGFAASMTPAQIAAVANYVRSHFGNIDRSDVTEADVAQVIAGKTPTNWLFARAALLAYIAIALIAVLLFLAVRRMIRRRSARRHVSTG